jgi:hypothetical protein
MDPALPGASSELDRALYRLETDGLVARDHGELRTTRKWQGAMARAAVRLYRAGDPGHDLRVPIAAALLEVYPSAVGDEELAELVEAMLPVELGALGLRGR